MVSRARQQRDRLVDLVAETSAPVVSVDASLMADVDEQEAETEDVVVAEADSTQDAQTPKKRRRRRHRRRSSGQGGDAQATEPNEATNGQDASETALSYAAAASADDPSAQTDEPVSDKTGKPARKVTRSRTTKRKPAVTAAEPETAKDALQAAGADSEQEQPEAKPKTKRARSGAKKSEPAAQIVSSDSVGEDGSDAAGQTTQTRSKSDKAKQMPANVDAQMDQTTSPASAPEIADAESVSDVVASEPALTSPAPEKPKKKGWWTLGK